MSSLFARIARRRPAAEAPGRRRPTVSGLMARVPRGAGAGAAGGDGARGAKPGRRGRGVREIYERMPHRRAATGAAATAPSGSRATAAAEPVTGAMPGAATGGPQLRGPKPPFRHRVRRLYDRLPHRRVAAGASGAVAPAGRSVGAVAAPAVGPLDGEQPTRPLPIGDTPPTIPKPPMRNRGRLRRRLRYLRRLRELQRRDLGGIVFELHRLGRRRDDLVTTKIGRLDATERELRALEGWLRAGQQLEEVREPGIGGTCPSCGELHGSSDRFCATCGVPLIVVVKPPRKP